MNSNYTGPKDGQPEEEAKAEGAAPTEQATEGTQEQAQAGEDVKSED